MYIVYCFVSIVENVFYDDKEIFESWTLVEKEKMDKIGISTPNFKMYFFHPLDPYSQHKT